MTKVELRNAIRACVAAPAGGLVAAYFAEDGPFAGATFDLLEGDRIDPNVVSPADLLATSLLDVAMPARFVREVLGSQATTMTDLLRDIPHDVELWNATRVHLDAAERAWDWLRTYKGINWVKAGKLLARKRPLLVPVLDSVVMKQLPLPASGAWQALGDALKDEELRSQVDDLRSADVDSRITTLRLLDVATWMRGSASKPAKAARARAGM